MQTIASRCIATVVLLLLWYSSPSYGVYSRTERLPLPLRQVIALFSVRCGALRFFQLLFVLRCQYRWIEPYGQLVDLAGEGERHLIIAIIDRRAGVGPDIKGFVPGQGQRDGAIQFLRRDHIAVDLESAGSRAAKP